MGDAWFALRPDADGRWTVPAAPATPAAGAISEPIPLRLQA